MSSVSSWIKALTIADINVLWSCPISLAFLLYFKCFANACRLVIDIEKILLGKLRNVFFLDIHFVIVDDSISGEIIILHWRFSSISFILYVLFTLVFGEFLICFILFPVNYHAASLLYCVSSDIFTLQHRHSKNQFSCLVVTQILNLLQFLKFLLLRYSCQKIYHNGLLTLFVSKYMSIWL